MLRRMKEARTAPVRAIAATAMFAIGAALLVAAGVSAGVTPGLHAPGLTPWNSIQVEGSRAIRPMLSVRILQGIFDPNQPGNLADFRQAMQIYRDNCNQLIATIRVIDPRDDHYDWIPDPNEPNLPDEWVTKSQTLALIEQFFAEFGDLFSHYQPGNEIFGGPGTYRAETVAEIDDVFDWFDEMVAAAEAGIIIGGHPELRVISPSLTQGGVRAGLRGGCSCAEFCDPNCPPECFNEPAQLNSYRVFKTVEFGNGHDGTDIHLHAECVAGMEDTIQLLRDPNNLIDLAADRLTCYEWSASKASKAWLDDENDPNHTRAWELIDFYERAAACRDDEGANCNDPNCVAPPTAAEWDAFVLGLDGWMQTQLDYGLDGFAVEALALMDAHGFEHAMYAGVYQKDFPAGGGLTDIYIWDVTKLHASKTTACPCDWCSITLNAFEAAAAAYPPTVGDVDCDNDVDLSDLAALLAAFNSCDGDANFNPNADFDHNGCINLSDLAALLGNYGFGA